MGRDFLFTAARYFDRLQLRGNDSWDAADRPGRGPATLRIAASNLGGRGRAVVCLAGFPGFDEERRHRARQVDS